MPSRQQLKQLQLALINAFPSRALLERLLYFELEKNLNEITRDSDLQEIIFKLIQTAEAQGWLEDLVRAAYNENPGNPLLKPIAQELLTGGTDQASSPNIPQKPSLEQQKILLLAALPQNLRLDKEIREVEEAIRRSVKRDSFEIKIKTAVRPQDIRRALAEERPQIVHFCGHGIEDGSLVLEDDSGNHKPVLPTGLAALFKLHTEYVKCVLLNACYSALPAEAISQHINYVIGMNQPIEELAAIVFAQGFYDGLGYDNVNNQDVITRAFDEGIVAIQLENLLQGAIPLMWKLGIAQSEIVPTPTSKSSDDESQSDRGSDYTQPEIVQSPQTDDLSSDRNVDIEQRLLAPKQAEYERQQEAIKREQEQVILDNQRRQAKVKKEDSLIIQTQSFEFLTAILSVSVKSLGFLGIGKTNEIKINHRRTKAEFFVEDLGNGISLEMVAIPGGTFLMSSSETEAERYGNESPQHQVTVPPFFMGKYPVTQAQWRTVASLPQVNRKLDPDPSYFKGNNLPVETISWYEAVEFCDRLSKHTQRHYRLPNEAEWEYACRAGTTTPFHFGETITTELANYNGEYIYGSAPKGEYRRQTTPVGNFNVANAFGLYDMHGNVWEWCADHWHGSYEGAPTDGNAWVKFNENDNQTIRPRMLRGGSWYFSPRDCRSACRDFNDNPDNRDFNIGFRVVVSAART